VLRPAVQRRRDERRPRDLAGEISKLGRAFCSIDIQLLCGRGLAETNAYLLAEGSPGAARALDDIRRAEAAGYFTDFSVEKQAASYVAYYHA